MNYKFSLEEGELIINEISRKKIVWKGKPLNCSVDSIVTNYKKDKCFAILSRSDGPRLYPGGPMKAFRNLICIDINGDVLWVADLPSSGTDYYVRVMWARDLQTDLFKIQLDIEADMLVAFSVSGFLTSVNPETGKLIQKLLIK
jgi:hypothetical protein